MFVAVFGFSVNAFSQCMVTDGGDDGSANQLRDCIEVQTDAVVEITVDVMLDSSILISRTVEINGNANTVTQIRHHFPMLDQSFE